MNDPEAPRRRGPGWLAGAIAAIVFAATIGWNLVMLTAYACLTTTRTPGLTPCRQWEFPLVAAIAVLATALIFFGVRWLVDRLARRA